MSNSHKTWMGLLAGALLLTACTASFATPVMDGLRDSEYTLIASSPKDNLMVDEPNLIDDPADPKAKCMDVTDFYASNSGNALYLYIELPYYNLANIYGDWGIAMHLKGANDGIERNLPAQDSYGAPVYFNHAPGTGVNMQLKSNFRGTAASSDGDQGWAYLNPCSLDGAGWNFPHGNFLGDNRWEVGSGIIHGFGNTGSEIVYKGGDGTPGNYGAIEVKLMFSDFGFDYPTWTNVRPPVIGETILMQWYATTRGEPGNKNNNHIRGPIDCVPFEAASRQDPNTGDPSPFGGYLTQYATYTLAQPASFEVSSAAAAGMTTVNVNFSDAVGDGGNTPANFVITNLANSATIEVTGAAIDSGTPSRVVLTTGSLPVGGTCRVTVSNVKSTGATLVNPARNSADFPVAIPVVFHLWDPQDIVGKNPDPNTGQNGKVTLTGSFMSWANDDGAGTGANELLCSPVEGQPGHYKSAPVLIPPGTIYYKYRLPHMLNYMNWDTLNYPGSPDRRLVIPAGSKGMETYDVACNATVAGTPVSVTFEMTDYDGIAAGRPVYVTGGGGLSGWSGDPTGAIAMTKTGEYTYTATATIPQGYLEYKYILIVEDPPGTYTTAWDDFGPNQYSPVVGSGTPLAQTIVNIFGTPPVPAYVKALRIAGGLEASPAAGAAFNALDFDKSGKIDILDAVALRKG